jgi:hypothetical protein
MSVGHSAEDIRPRLAVLTDIGGDPDDQQSMIRLMVYANEFRIQALIATASGGRRGQKESATYPELIQEIIDGYGRVLPNLRKHANGWPDADAVRRTVKTGNPRRGLEFIGGGHDTEGSRELVKLIDAASPEDPLNIAVWGGQTDLAQALWRVKHDRDADGYREFTRRMRVYDINDQDDIADWMLQEFPGLHFILAKCPPGHDKREGTYRGMYLTGDDSQTSRDWIQKHVLSRGPLGALYPTKTWTAPNPHSCLKEGDTPSWFFFLPRGGNNPSDPTAPGWGGRFQKTDGGWYRDLPKTSDFDPRTTVSRWRSEFQADFAERMSWCEE